MSATPAVPRFACQSYSWQMSIDRYRGRLGHLASVAADAGFSGFEPETVMLAPDWDAGSIRSDLGAHGLELAALCLVAPWRSPSETLEERRYADRVIDAVAALPGAIINLVQYPGEDRSDLRERQRNALGCMRALAQRAAERSVAVSFHPNSPPGSVFRTAEDYRVLFEELDPTIGYTPDTGHLAAGGMDPLEVISAQRDRVRYLHVKDRFASGRWAPTGRGAVDIVGIVRYLLGSGYDGWITFEDESPEAESDPDAAVLATGAFVRGHLAPDINERSPR